MIAYHGTHSGVVEAIRRDGLLPDQHGAVYLTPDRDCAEHFAVLAGDDHGTAAVVLIVRLPDDAPVRPLAMGPWNAFEHTGPIPPDWLD